MALGGIVRGKNVTLRTPKEEDLPSVNGLMADMRVRRGGHLWEEPATLATWKERLKEAAKDESAVLWTIDVGTGFAGTIRVALHGPNAYVQHFILDPAIWGRGYGTDAAIALHRYLFDYLDKKTAGLELAADSGAGWRIAQRLGYREFGRGHDVYYRDGGYTDQVWLRLTREMWDERWPAEREYAPLPEGAER
jgi:RimJ/RimL family protein N-acetyltransferase